MKKVDVYALVCALIIAFGWFTYAQEVKKSEPVDMWFEVKNLAVPNFIQGDDPNVVYDRVVKKEFDATWNVEIHNATPGQNDFPICTGSGVNHYQPKETVPEAGVKMSWFMGDFNWASCKSKIKEGQYIMQAHWEVRPPGYPTKYTDYTSNPFRVLPTGAQLYITPDQSTTLKTLQENVK